jgi:PadR family transcriptional regulator PadR
MSYVRDGDKPSKWTPKHCRVGWKRISVRPSPACLLYSLPMVERTEIPPGTLYMLVLKTLARIGPMHGYGIAHHIQQMSEEVLVVEEGSLYPALQRMLIKGWLIGEWKQTENNRRARFYRLTPAGRKQLSAELVGFERVMGAIAKVIQPA